jgi:DnaJ-class molecular chaperone
VRPEKHEKANQIVTFDHAPFKLRDVDPSLDNSDWNRNPGDTELTVDIDAIDVITGTWLTVKDFLGESLQVRVPAGHNPLHPLRISSKGYMGWDTAMQQPSGKRADMYLRLNVIFNPPSSIEKQKIVNLYNQIKDA